MGPATAAGSGSAGPSLRGYRTLAYWTAGLTFALIVVGGIVRISDSGLGCGPEGAGTEGWPLCGGRIVPVVDTNMIVEYAHRILAAAVTVMIAMLAYKAWRHFRENRALVRTSVGALGLIIVQAALGGLTVERGLEDELVAIHLGVAMIQIALVLLIARLALPVEATRGGEHLGTTRAMRVLAVSATVAALATIVAGGYIAGTEKNGSPDEPRAIGAHSACGSDFPSCGGELWPYGRSRAVDIHLTHRAFMYLTVALVVALFVVALRQRRRLDPEAARRLTRGARASLGVLATQVLLGAANVWAGEEAWLIIAHLTVGALLWVVLVLVSFEALGVRQRSAAGAPRAARAEVAPA